MSNTPSYSDNLIPPEGRRARVRQPVGALAYLDIGTDNGGIVLNLSEDGLGLQAVAPLENQREVSLRIQLPHSPERIETAAEVAWLGASNRQAGVRFLNLSAAARSQIREWIKSQESAPVCEETEPARAPEVAMIAAPEPATETRVTSSPVPPPAPAPSAPPLAVDAQTGKWLSLMAEFETDMKAGEGPQLAPAPQAPPAPPPSAPPSSKPAIVSRRLNELWRDSAPDAPLRTPPSDSTLAPAQQPGVLRANPRAPGPDSESTSLASTAVRKSSTGDRDAVWPVVSAPTPVSLPTVPPLGPALELVRTATTERTPGKAPVESKPKQASGFTPRRARNQAAIVAAFALFSILCFGVGTRVGRLAMRQIPPPATPAAPPVPNLGLLPKAAARTRLPDAHRARRTDTKAAPGTRALRKFAEGTKPGGALVLPQTQVATSLPETPTSTPMSEVLSRVSLSPDLWARSSVKPSPSGAAATPGSSESGPEASAPRVVDGYELKPSDRFNPCHLTYRVEPTYPPQALEQGIQGTVKIHLIIDADGSVQSATLISGPPPLAPAALDAAKYWRYLPALLNGQPIPIEKDVEVDFHLPPR